MNIEPMRLSRQQYVTWLNWLRGPGPDDAHSWEDLSDHELHETMINLTIFTLPGDELELELDDEVADQVAE